MPVIENAYEIEYENLEEMLTKAKAEFKNAHKDNDYLYPYLLGTLKAAYESLCIHVDIAHNQKIKNEKDSNNY